MRQQSDPVQGFSPAGQLLHLITGFWTSQAIHVAAELGIADLLGRKPQSVEELARKSGADADALHRLLRALAGVGVVAEPVPRQFALSPMTVLLREDTPGNLRAFARFQGEGWHWGCWGDLLSTVRSGKPATLLRHGAANCFEYLANHPESARRFDDAMGAYSAQVHAAVVDAYDFSGAARIADIGGGTGTLLATVLSAAPRADGILFDRAAVLAGAPEVLQAHGVAARCSMVAGDFFASVPVSADLFLLSAILHDWDDEPAAAILRQVAAAMPAGARILIVENVIPDDAQPHPGKLIDLEMLVVAGGRERTEAQFAALFASAGLRLSRVVSTAVSASIIEAMAA